MDTDHYLLGSHYFFVESSGRFVEVDGIRVGSLQLNTLSAVGLLKLKLSSWASTTRRKGPKRNGDMTELEDDEAEGLREWVKEFQDLKQWQELDSSYKS
ncbi:hypothetical protein TSTA_054770 [Talaromyces stipitatus ATCC 10500]|uniref:Uncharacterized protein n=1 Tax=Talaromyces stipitatus (strain ATCC 10500 / CBS 375.48 / QM 6759 / NRRL 1006) TaxID=441959 RepID=B8MR72_TALSN|nr:uncharacterized protein TSTA_054770 [Talaromyces stipitatus ATCC 10500]EED12967.1 hypothetical protein TSTA_054770 [Talaromyces stipitatus ATCC 10500]